MENTNMCFCEIVPFVRFAADVYIADSKNIAVTAYDHRLFYVVSGNAVIDMNGVEKNVNPGAVLYWMSGTPYSIQPHGDMPLHMISVNFDFTQEHSSTMHCIPMVQSCDYNKSQRLENICFTDTVLLNTPVFIRDGSEFLPYLRAMLRETAMPKIQADFQLCNLMRVVLVLLCRQAAQRQQGKASAHAASVILDYINAHYTEELDNRQLAKRFNYHPNYLSQLIAEQTGTPLHQYLIKLRIRQAIYLLQNTQLSVSEISRQTGFKSPSYFSHYFKQCTGYSPREFRI